MGHLKCSDCGTEASYADARRFDMLKTCGCDYEGGKVVEGTGEEHDWYEVTE